MKDMSITVKRSIELVGLCTLGLLIIAGQSVLMPLLIAFFISLLMLPSLRWLQKRGIPEALAIVLCIIGVFIVIGGIATFLSFQIGVFVSDIDAIKKNINIHWGKLSTWITSKTDYTLKEQLALIQKQGTSFGNNITNVLQGALVSMSGVFIFVGLLPIYIFLILFYRNLILRFVYLWFDESAYPKVQEAVSETEVIVKFYLVGLMIQIAYLTVLVGGILLLFGIKHAILIGITFAILNLIPYIGALIGNLIGVLLTLTTSQELWQIWVVLGTIAFVQFLDNNILMPRIVGSKVKINALASIVGIFIGGAMIGVGGMFLSIPIMAVLKIVFDKTSYLKQWGVLLGESRPDHNPAADRRVKRKIRSKKDDDTKEEE